MGVREKLVELINDCRAMEGYGMDLVKRQADHLIANGVTVQEWVPVDDRLPEKDGEYLAWFGKNVVKQHAEILSFAKDGDTVDNYDLRNEKNVWFYDDYEIGYLVCHGITHWMPIPQPPKGE